RFASGEVIFARRVAGHTTDSGRPIVASIGRLERRVTVHAEGAWLCAIRALKVRALEGGVMHRRAPLIGLERMAPRADAVTRGLLDRARPLRLRCARGEKEKWEERNKPSHGDHGEAENWPVFTSSFSRRCSFGDPQTISGTLVVTPLSF